VINLYNIKGQMVKTLVDEVLPAGYHQITWNGCTNSGKQTASGFYLLQMQSGSFSCVKKLILLK
jgi:flagellar hook assembly protein FlgD